jgi:hypothetical protein
MRDSKILLPTDEQLAAFGGKLPEHVTLWGVRWRVEKRHADPRERPYEVIEDVGNLLVTNGRNLLWKALRGDAITAFSSANARLGVGDSSTAEAIAQTDLQAATNKLRKAMDSGWPKVGTADGLATDNLMELKSSFADGEANWVWNEWATFNAASGATSMLNRKVASMGTKASGVWTLTVTLTLT